jgi:formiminotetrahydrofolate cyclodeaminase
MEKMIDALLQSIKDDEGKEEARKTLETILNSIQNLKNRINAGLTG